MSFAVVVTFDIHAKHFDAFVRRVETQAADSLTLEDECHEFRVWADEASPHKIYLYEVYKSATAFDAHLKSEHFLAFDQEVAEWIVSKQVSTWNRLIS